MFVKVFCIIWPGLLLGVVFLSFSLISRRFIKEPAKLDLPDIVHKTVTIIVSIAGLLLLIQGAKIYTNTVFLERSPVIFVGSGTVYEYLKELNYFTERPDRWHIAIDGGSLAGANLLSAQFRRPPHDTPKSLIAMSSIKLGENDFSRLKQRRVVGIRLQESIAISVHISRNLLPPVEFKCMRNPESLCFPVSSIFGIMNEHPEANVYVGTSSSGTRRTLDEFWQVPNNLNNRIHDTTLNCRDIDSIENSILIGSFFDVDACKDKIKTFTLTQSEGELIARPLYLYLIVSPPDFEVPVQACKTIIELLTIIESLKENPSDAQCAKNQFDAIVMDQNLFACKSFERNSVLVDIAELSCN